MSVDMSESRPEMDVKQHEETYEGFIKGVKYSTIAVVITLIALAIGFFVI